MAKVTKKQLKAVVKECLVEILSEGLDGNIAGLSEKRQRVQRQNGIWSNYGNTQWCIHLQFPERFRMILGRPEIP